MRDTFDPNNFFDLNHRKNCAGMTRTLMYEQVYIPEIMSIEFHFIVYLKLQFIHRVKCLLVCSRIRLTDGVEQCGQFSPHFSMTLCHQH